MTNMYNQTDVQELVESLTSEQVQLLRDTFYSAINYWSPQHGWEEDAFAEWIQHRVTNAKDFD